MKKGVLILFLFVIVNLFQFVSADVLSLNSGGDEELVINPDNYIEGFFSGVQVLSSCGNGILETPYEECDDGNYVSGDGCSATCTIEVVCGDGHCNGGETCSSCSADCGTCEVKPPTEPTKGGINISVDPTEIKIYMLVNSNIEESVGITNLRNSSANFSVSSSGFDSDLIVNFWDTQTRRWVSSFSLTLSGGGIENLRIRFSAPPLTGVYNGTILIDGKRVNVNVTVQEKLLLFDSNIIVLNDNYLVPQGDKLRTSVTLIPLGDKERMDVTLNYIIKDYEGHIYLTRSETVLIKNQVNFKRNFDTGILPLGQYIVGLELIYPNGVAPSSAHFEVTQGRQNTFFGKAVFFLINLILIVLILIIILIIFRIIKQIIANKKIGEKHLDLTITGAKYGKGKRSAMMSSFILSCKGKEDSEYLEIGEAGRVEEKHGEGELNLEKLNELLKPLIISTGEKVKIRPKVVVAVACQDVQKSPTYNSGWMLKSPRVTALRPRKNLSDIAKLKDIEKNFEVKKEEKSENKEKDKEKPKQKENPEK